MEAEPLLFSKSILEAGQSGTDLGPQGLQDSSLVLSCGPFPQGEKAAEPGRVPNQSLCPLL